MKKSMMCSAVLATGMLLLCATHSIAEDCGGSMDCFLERAKNCQPVTATMTNHLDMPAHRLSGTVFFEIRGMEGEKCVYYQRLGDYSQSFLPGAPVQPSEAKKMEEDNVWLDISEGADWTCRLSMEDLQKFLSQFTDTSGVISSSIPPENPYNCEGELFMEQPVIGNTVRVPDGFTGKTAVVQYANGSTKSELVFENGAKVAENVYRENGALWLEAKYRDGKVVYFKKYNRQGQPVKEKQY